ncbi:MAG: flavodoxin [Firmicutes bacterium]|nr:flavodoxin [Bacillota bacterium]
MHQVAVIFWSGTGNTEAMAKAITEGVNKAGGEAQLFNVADIHVDRAASYDNLILGCPSMGGEVLEEYEFEPFYTALEEKINGKKIALFGSYGWGDGEWMRDWQTRVENHGGNLFEEGLIINDTPDTAGLALCEAFGTRFVNSL